MAALRAQEYDEIQISDIARDASVARGTIYRYFTSKDELYAAVLLEWSAPALTVAAAGSDDRPAATRIRARMDAIISAFERSPQFFKAWVSLRATADPNALRLINEFADRAIAGLATDFAGLPCKAGGEDLSTMMWSIFATMLTGVLYGERTMADVRRMSGAFIDLAAGELSERSLD